MFWVDPADDTQGMVCSLQDQSSTGIQWYIGEAIETGATGTEIGTGATNTTAIITAQGSTATDYAAGIARAHDGGGFSDWFLPSKDELMQVYLKRGEIYTTAIANGGTGIGGNYYWTSSERGINLVWVQNFWNNGGQGGGSKDLVHIRVRAVRAVSSSATSSFSTLAAEQTAHNTAIEANTIKVGITTDQSEAIEANTIKVGITTDQSDAIDANTSKVGMPTGTATGEMNYWNGSAWVLVNTSLNEGATLQMIAGVPTWTGGTPPLPTVTSLTGRIWMDRNLGASQVATSGTDVASYGDLYQWGRGTDGHEKRNSGTTSISSTTNTPGHGDFIYIQVDPYDWRSPQNTDLWQGTDGGVNNPCPNEYRLPTEAEWVAERETWASENEAGAFASTLKLPMTGSRIEHDSSISTAGTWGVYWSSTINATNSERFVFSESLAVINTWRRANACAVRCIKKL